MSTPRRTALIQWCKQGVKRIPRMAAFAGISKTTFFEVFLDANDQHDITDKDYEDFQGYMRKIEDAEAHDYDPLVSDYQSAVVVKRELGGVYQKHELKPRREEFRRWLEGAPARRVTISEYLGNRRIDAGRLAKSELYYCDIADAHWKEIQDHMQEIERIEAVSLKKSAELDAWLSESLGRVTYLSRACSCTRHTIIVLRQVTLKNSQIHKIDWDGIEQAKKIVENTPIPTRKQKAIRINVSYGELKHVDDFPRRRKLREWSRLAKGRQANVGRLYGGKKARFNSSKHEYRRDYKDSVWKRVEQCMAKVELLEKQLVCASVMFNLWLNHDKQRSKVLRNYLNVSHECIDRTRYYDLSKYELNSSYIRFEKMIEKMKQVEEKERKFNEQEAKLFAKNKTVKAKQAAKRAA